MESLRPAWETKTVLFKEEKPSVFVILALRGWSHWSARSSRPTCPTVWALLKTKQRAKSSLVGRKFAEHTQGPGSDPQHCINWVRLHMSVIIAIETQRKEGQRFKTSLGDRGNWSVIWPRESGVGGGGGRKSKVNKKVWVVAQWLCFPCKKT